MALTIPDALDLVDPERSGTFRVRHHVYDTSGRAFVDGCTNISVESMIDLMAMFGPSCTADLIIGDAPVFSRMLKCNLVDFIPTPDGADTMPTFMGIRVHPAVIESTTDLEACVCETWVLARHAEEIHFGHLVTREF